MKKVIFYIYSLNKGGAERVLLTLAEKLNNASDVDIAILTDTIAEREYNLPADIRRINLDDYMIKKLPSKLNAINRLIAIRKCIKNEKPDEVVAFMVSSAIRAILALLGTRYKVIAAVRSNPYDEYGESNKQRQLCNIFSHSKKIICQTDYQKDFFIGLQDKCKVIFNPIFDDFCVEPYVGDRKHTVVATGRLFDYKNHKLLMDAFAKIAHEYNDYELVIYGEGPYREELEKEISRLDNYFACEDLAKRIHLPGDSDNVAEDIKDAAIYVLPSDTEGMPNALMEAMALGLPCISTDCPCGGPKSLILNGTNGLLVPVGDVEAMASALDELMSDEIKRENLGREATNIKIICDADKIAGEWKEVLGVS